MPSKSRKNAKAGSSKQQGEGSNDSRSSESGGSKGDHRQMQLQQLEARLASVGALMDGEGNEEDRRAIWLQLLALVYQPIARFPASFAAGSSIHGVTSLESSSPPSSASSSSTPATPALTSSVSTGEETNLDHSTLSLLDYDPRSGIQLDAEGWQIGISGDKASKLLQPPSADDSGEWQMAGSRKTRRKMSSQKSSSSQALSQASGSEAGDRLDGLFGSAVDVKSVQVMSDSLQAPGGSQQTVSSTSSSPLLPSDDASVDQSSSTSASPEPNHSSFSNGSTSIEEEDGWQKAGKKRSKRKYAQATPPSIETVQQQLVEKKTPLPEPVPQPSDDDQQKNSTPTATKPKPCPFESQPQSKPANLTSYNDHLPAHRDEHQVDLDVRRSFIGFDTHGKGSRDARRRQLSDIIVGTLRRHPALNYYQGYHDLVSVLLLVISPENPTSIDQPWASETDFNLVLQANIRFTLFYLRDFLAKRLDPCLGWLKVLRNIIREEDEDLARRVVEKANPLPFFALSWVISAFCHDLKFQSEEARQVLDQVLVKGPEVILKLVAALILERGGKKIEASDVGENEEDSAMLHHALAGLPGQLESEGGDLSLQTLLKRADSIPSTSLASKETIMGPQSILRCWSPPLSMEAEKLPVLEKQAESYLSLPADRIVIDPTPSPPAISPSIEEKEGGYFNGKKRQPTRSTTSKGSKTVLLVGGVTILVAGTAVFLQATAGHDRHSQKQALKEMTELGRGLFSLAICGAAGIC